MNRQSSAKRYGFIGKICLLCIVLTCIFILTACTSSTTKEHSCTFATTQLNNDTKTDFISKAENTNVKGCYRYYLGENISLSSTLKIPEGTFIGICVDEFKITVSGDASKPLYEIVDTDNNPANNVGGIYLFDCGDHAVHSQVFYQYVDQTAFDFFGQSGSSMYDVMGASKSAYHISIRDDVSIPSTYTSLQVPAGKTLYVCTNGHSFNCDVDLEAKGGRVAYLNCKDSGFHECIYLDDGAVGITQSGFASVADKVIAAQPGDEFYLYLNGNISWDEELVIPEGVVVYICLNGHSATGDVKKGTYTVTGTDEETGETVTVEKTYGELIVLDCSHHLCSGVCMTGEMIAINKNSIGWTVDFLTKYIADPESPEIVYCVLEDDVAIPRIDGVTLVVCVNGFKNRDNQWYTKTVDGNTVTTGGIIYYNCASSHTCEIASMVGLENRSILLDTADGANMSFEQMEQDGVTSACFSLTSDLKGSGELVAPEGTFVILCLNGYSMGDVKVKEGTSIFVYECAREYCFEMKNDVMSLDQGMMNILAAYAASSNQPYPINTNYIFALSEDIVVPAGAIAVAEGCTVNFCTHGYTITGLDNVTGVVTHKGCTHRITNHLCAVSDMIGQSSQPINAKSAGTVNAALAGLSSGIHFFHLTENLVGTGEISAPEGAIVGICLDGFSKGDITVADGSKVFFYECGKHYCTADGANIPTFDQAAFDFLTYLSGGKTIYVNNSTKIAISEDVTLSADLYVADGNLLSICTCGHTITIPEYEGYVDIHDDLDMAAKNHFCVVPYVVNNELSSSALYASNAAMLNSAFAKDAEIGFGFYHLTSDVYGGTIELPENFLAMICLNGHKLYNVEIPEGATIFFYECGVQYCSAAGGEIPAFHQSVFDFFEQLMLADAESSDPESGEENPFFGMYLAEDLAFALIGDVNIPFDILVEDGYTLHICTCGYNLTTSEGVKLTNVVTHDTCAPSARGNNGTVSSNTSPTYTGCAVCDSNMAVPLNYASLRDMIDNTGVVKLPAGSYYYYLENDFQLSRMLIIPEGVDLHICLHGHTLYSAYLWNDITTYGAGFPEYQCSAVVVIKSGANFNIHDCSEKMTGKISLKQFRYRDADGNMRLAFDIIDSNILGDISSIEQLAVQLGTVAINEGVLNVYGGNIYAITGILNGEGGVVNYYNGNLYTLFAAVMSMDFVNGTEVKNSHIYIGEGATLSSVYAGIYSTGGEVVVDGGTINAGIMGIACISENGTESITINGGEINIGSSNRLVTAAMSTWSTLGGGAADLSGMNLDIEEDEYVGVMTSGSLTLNGDVNIVMGEMTVTKEDGKERQGIDFYLTGGNEVTVSDKVDGRYTLDIDSDVEVGDNDVFVPLNGAIKYESPENGELIVRPFSGEFNEYADLIKYNVSPEGDVKINIDTYVDPLFAETGRVRFCIKYGDESRMFTLDDAEKIYDDATGTLYYRFSFHTAAKDYATAAIAYFILLPDSTLGDQDPFKDYVGVYISSEKFSIQTYLDSVIFSRVVHDDETIFIAKALKNYCAAAAYHFDVAENYTIVDGMQPYLNMVTVEALDPYKAVKGTAFNTSPVIYKTATVVLKSETAIRIYFDLAEGYTLITEEGNTFIVGTVDGEQVKIPLTVKLGEAIVDVTVTETGVETRPYCIEIYGVCAVEYFDMYALYVGDEHYMSYSVASYVRTVVSNKNNKYSDDVVDVAKSMIVYGAASAELFGSSNQYAEGGTQ